MSHTSKGEIEVTQAEALGVYDTGDNSDFNSSYQLFHRDWITQSEQGFEREAQIKNIISLSTQEDGTRTLINSSDSDLNLDSIASL
jgi:hypothetical protein